MSYGHLFLLNLSCIIVSCLSYNMLTAVFVYINGVTVLLCLLIVHSHIKLFATVYVYCLTADPVNFFLFVLINCELAVTTNAINLIDC